MKTYRNCRTWSTGLSKPHTLALTCDEDRVSIVYYDPDLIPDDFKLIAIAYDTRGHKYEIVGKEDRRLAVPF